MPKRPAFRPRQTQYAVQAGPHLRSCSQDCCPGGTYVSFRVNANDFRGLKFGAYLACHCKSALPVQEEKVSEAERELNEAQRRVEAARGAYETIVQRMSEELVRFQRERAAEFAAVLRAFAAAQAQLAADSAKAWRALAPVALAGAPNGAAAR